MIDGKTLIAWGFQPGRHFKDLIGAAQAYEADGLEHDKIFLLLQDHIPVELTLRTNSLPYELLIDAENDHERANVAAVAAHMDVLMRVPTVVAGAVMPDACPSGSAPGTIPVGGVIAAKDAIHPGMHSSDVCCSVAMTVFKREDHPRKILDAVMLATHFGPGGRAKPIDPPKSIMQRISLNNFLVGLEDFAFGQFASQGDGNHFAYVGHLKSTGQPVLVTHHGSRGLGAQLYKRGIAAAKKHTAIHAPKVPGHNAWIKASSKDGEAYWDALQIVRDWTKASHFQIHDLVAGIIGNAVVDRFWNEHNFVFQKSDGLFYHGKGATPSWDGFSNDDDGRTLIPLNMSEPILIASHRSNKRALGFAPHGAGRNFSRTQHLKNLEHQPDDELAYLLDMGLDIRSFCGIPDFSELPSAYKNAAAVRSQIAKYDLAKIEDEVVPYGSVMAGDWERDAPWKKKRQAASSPS
jgi:tRNA-splicing ligase RtcB